MQALEEEHTLVVVVEEEEEPVGEEVHKGMVGHHMGRSSLVGHMQVVVGEDMEVQHRLELQELGQVRGIGMALDRVGIEALGVVRVLVEVVEEEQRRDMVA